MTTDANTPTDASDEAAVERAVRDILFPLDQRLEQTTNWGCSVAGFVALGLFVSLFFGTALHGWLAALLALGVPFAVWAVVGALLDVRLAGQARMNFDRRFPVDHPARGLAVRMLSEMECPNKAHEKLRAALRV